MSEEIYLGDDVYATFDGEAITLTCNEEEIRITGYTMKSLLEFMNKLGVIKL